MPDPRADTNERKDEVLARLSALWKADPELRLMQLICNVIPGDLYYVEDFRLIEALEAQYRHE